MESKFYLTILINTEVKRLRMYERIIHHAFRPLEPSGIKKLSEKRQEETTNSTHMSNTGNKRTTFVFHKIVIYNPWTWKQSEDSLKISLTPKRSEFYRCSKAFSVMAWDWGQNRSLHFVSCVFSVWSNKRCRRLTKLQVNTKIK